ncbi:helix-turn-helix domain-containing protein [Myxococcus xanthus]|uniref:helix-turn-helix domain-containing protein n=1 Tax=Myxococcus xanthus TaxID=34 RepID=UPI00191746A9|nr:helix-turn-helix domain-containing protein [Myxococcus xanthus]QQR42263.1 helix-turn-helix domain-containing protein [Myxococcus xanthus]
MSQVEHRDFKKKSPNKIERRLHGYKGQWVAIPTTLARHWFELGLKPEDALLLIALLSFKLDERPPFPGIGTLAKSINKSHPTLYRHLEKLEGAGFLKRHRRPNKSNEYDLSGLIEKIRKYEGAADTSEDVREQESEQPQDTAEHVPLTTNPARRAALKAKLGVADLEPSNALKKQESAVPAPSPNGDLFPKRLLLFNGQPYDFSVPGTPPPARPPPAPAPPPRSKEERLRDHIPEIRGWIQYMAKDRNLGLLRVVMDEEIFEVGLPLVPDAEDLDVRAKGTMTISVAQLLVEKLRAEPAMEQCT